MPRDEEDLPENEDEDEPTAPPPAATASKARGGKKAQPARNGVGAPPDDAPRDATELWEWILADMGRKGISPHQVRIAVYQVDPPSPAGGEFNVGFIPGGSVLGDATRDPGQALFDYLVNNFHLTRPASRTAVRYSVRFSWAVNSQQFKRGELTLPPASEIMAIRAETERARQGGDAPATGVGQPMRDASASQPFYPPPNSYAPPSYYPPPPYAQQPAPGFGSPEQMLDFMREMFRASMEQRPPVIPAGMQPPPGIAAPPPLNEQALTERITASVVMTLKQLGILDKPQPQTVATPPPATVAPKSAIEKAFDRVFDAAVSQFTAGVETSIKKSIAGVGRPPEDDDEPDERPQSPTGLAAPETPPEEALPFRVRAVPEAKWRDGRPINYADDEDGKPSIQGMLASNPIILETGMDAVVGLAGAVKDFIGRVGAQASAPLGKPPEDSPQQLAAPPTPETPAAPPTPDWKG